MIDLVLLISFHTILWFLYYYFTVKYKEKHKIKNLHYFTITLGDGIGFTLVVIAFYPLIYFINLIDLMISVIISFFITLLLHIYWSKSSIWQISSVYTLNYKGTFPAYLHNLYVFFMSNIIFLYLLYLIFYNKNYTLELFYLGIFIYFISCIIDHKRGLI